MISPDDYYEPLENPSDKQKILMWNAVQRGIGGKGRTGFFVIDWRSFAYGAVASVVLIFACVGLYSTVGRLIDSSKPHSVRLETAYESAIQQFERFIPAGANADSEQKSLIVRGKDQLRYIDGAIEQMRKEISGTDISPLKRARLRQLYSTKLEILQELIEQTGSEL